MKKYFICSDIHSFYDEWIKALEDKGFDINNPEHTIILCGDLLDRGPKPIECLEFVDDLIDKERIICIMGNHETLLFDKGIHRWFTNADAHNGTDKTAIALAGYDPLIPMFEGEIIDRALTNPLWMKYFDECDKHWYYETDHYIFVHSWIPQYNDDWRNTDDVGTYDEWWESAVWGNPFVKWFGNECQGIDGKTVVFGHWHTSWAWCRYRGFDREFLEEYETMWTDENGVTHPTVCYNIYEDNGIIGLDACTAASHQVNILVLEEL